MRRRTHQGRETRIALLNIVQHPVVPRTSLVNGRQGYGLKTAIPVSGRNRKEKTTSKGPCFLESIDSELLGVNKTLTMRPINIIYCSTLIYKMRQDRVRGGAMTQGSRQK